MLEFTSSMLANLELFHSFNITEQFVYTRRTESVTEIPTGFTGRATKLCCLEQIWFYSLFGEAGESQSIINRQTINRASALQLEMRPKSNLFCPNIHPFQGPIPIFSQKKLQIFSRSISGAKLYPIVFKSSFQSFWTIMSPLSDLYVIDTRRYGWKPLVYCRHN